MQKNTVICFNREIGAYWNERQVVPDTSYPDVGGAANGCYGEDGLKDSLINKQLGELTDHHSYMARGNFTRWSKCRVPLGEIAFDNGNQLMIPYFPDGSGQRPIVDWRSCQNHSRQESNLIGAQYNPDLTMHYGICAEEFGQCGIGGCKTPYPKMHGTEPENADGSMSYVSFYA